MTQNEQQASRDHAVARLGLEIAAPIDGPKRPLPTDEELAALYDNRLTGGEREVILQFIASNPQVYARWIRLVELAGSVQTVVVPFAQPQVSQIARTSHVPAKPGLLVSLKAWIEQISSAPSFLGSGLATAAVVVIAVSLFPKDKSINLSDDLSSYYSNFGPALTQKASALTPPPASSTERSFELPKARTAVQQVIATGFLSGTRHLSKDLFKSWGYAVDEITPVRPNAATGVTAEQYALLFEVGRLNALLSLPCRAGSLGDAERLFPVADSLLTKLEQGQTDTLKDSISQFRNTQEKTAALCGLSAAIDAQIFP